MTTMSCRPNWKPAKGTARRAQIKRSLGRQATEKARKAQVRRLDPLCRWPHEDAEERAICQRMRKEVAHVFAKGMGGDKQLLRTRVELMLRACLGVHQGPNSFHQQTRRVVFLTPKKCRGPLAFEEKRGGRWVEVGREIHVGVLA